MALGPINASPSFVSFDPITDWQPKTQTPFRLDSSDQQPFNFHPGQADSPGPWRPMEGNGLQFSPPSASILELRNPPSSPRLIVDEGLRGLGTAIGGYGLAAAALPGPMKAVPIGLGLMRGLGYLAFGDGVIRTTHALDNSVTGVETPPALSTIARAFGATPKWASRVDYGTNLLATIPPMIWGLGALAANEKPLTTALATLAGAAWADDAMTHGLSAPGAEKPPFMLERGLINLGVPSDWAHFGVRAAASLISPMGLAFLGRKL